VSLYFKPSTAAGAIDGFTYVPKGTVLDNVGSNQSPKNRIFNAKNTENIFNQPNQPNPRLLFEQTNPILKPNKSR
jgi:hypothetical protein